MSALFTQNNNVLVTESNNEVSNDLASYQKQVTSSCGKFVLRSRLTVLLAFGTAIILWNLYHTPNEYLTILAAVLGVALTLVFLCLVICAHREWMEAEKQLNLFLARTHAQEFKTKQTKNFS